MSKSTWLAPSTNVRLPRGTATTGKSISRQSSMPDKRRPTVSDGVTSKRRTCGDDVIDLRIGQVRMQRQRQLLCCQPPGVRQIPQGGADGRTRRLIGAEHRVMATDGDSCGAYLLREVCGVAIHDLDREQVVGGRAAGRAQRAQRGAV